MGQNREGQILKFVTYCGLVTRHDRSSLRLDQLSGGSSKQPHWSRGERCPGDQGRTKCHLSCQLYCPQWRICITRKASRDKFCFPSAMSEQTTGGRMESRLVGVALIFLVSNIVISVQRFLTVCADFFYLLLKVFAQSSQSVTIQKLSLFS